ncbi:MAG: class I SAM-dependent methyltransferase [Chloroflexi bacterium]|nr:class I SAM-dependent methyltransferase [Chloroflexota bacterium]
MERYIQANLQHWNEVTPIHVRSRYYDVDGFKAGRHSLQPIERVELGNVTGKSLLHLQCHFGLDTLSWARLGARATGVDFSGAAITQAQTLSYETGVPAAFICSNLYDLPKVLDAQFDVVFTSYGVLSWLPDIRRWAEIVARYVKPGGLFYIVEIHPVSQIFDDDALSGPPAVKWPYFYSPDPEEWQPIGSYADRTAKVSNPTYNWRHSLSDIVNAVANAGLRLEFLHEFPYTVYQQFPFMEQGSDGFWRLKGYENSIPLLFSIKATKV